MTRLTRDLLLVEISRALRAASPDRAEDLIREAEKRIACKAEFAF